MLSISILSATLFLVESTAMALANACCLTILLHSLYLLRASGSLGRALGWEGGREGGEGEREEGGREGGKEGGRKGEREGGREGGKCKMVPCLL